MGHEDGHRKKALTQLERTVREHMPAVHTEVPLPELPDRADRVLHVLGAMGGWITELDERGRILYASPAVERILGFTPEEILTSDVLEFHPDDVPEVIRA